MIEPTLPRQPWPFLLRYVARRPWQFGGLLCVIVGAAACAVAVQYGMKLIVDAMTAGPRETPRVWDALLFFVVLIALESGLWRLGGWLGCRAVVATGVDIRLDLFRHLTGHAMHFFTEHLSGALGNRLTATAGAAGTIIGAMAWHILPPALDLVGAVILLASIDKRMALVLVAIALILGMLIAAYGARGRPLHQAFAREGSRVNGELVDVVANMWTVKAFSAGEREHRRLAAELGIEASAQQRSWMYLERVRVAHDIFLWLLAAGMLAWAIQRWRTGIGTPGDVVLVSTLTFRSLHGSRDFALSLVAAAQQFAVIAEMLKVIALPHRLVDAPDAKPFRLQTGDITLDNVTYSYANGHRVFDRFSLHVSAGERLGIVGPSGAGKSTLFGLIQRLDDVQAGEIRIDGQPVRSLQQDSLRRALAVVPQDIALFDISIADNIRYGRPDATDTEVRQAARDAYCDEFIRILPDGYDTRVGERGARLSGGQRQRIGVARAFLVDAHILLLDEATSALDSRSEVEVQRATERLMQDRTVIAVAHRLSTVASFDRIIVVANGRIIEEGSPTDLRDRGGTFATLWRMQTEGLNSA